MARKGKIQLIMSPEIIDEIQSVLLYPKIMKRHRRPAEEIEAFLKKLMKVAVIIRSGARLDVIKDAPSDNKYLECAVEGNADYIISGDKHLTDLQFFRGIKIIDPAKFLKQTLKP